MAKPKSIYIFYNCLVTIANYSFQLPCNSLLTSLWHTFKPLWEMILFQTWYIFVMTLLQRKNEEQHISFFFSVCQWQRCKDSIQDLKLRCYLVLIERPGLIATKDGMSSISMEQIQNDITNTLNWQHKVYSLEIGLEMKNARWDSHVTPLNSQSHT